MRPHLLMPLLTFSVSFVAYLFTLSPTVGLEDSGEFITAVASLGVAHPSGYPLYVVLGKLFTLLIPLGDVAWRVNLFSAFCASATIGLLSLFITKALTSLSPHQDENAHARASLPALLIAGAMSLSFAFSPVFWSQSVIAEVYTLNSFLVVATLFMLWRYWLYYRASTLYGFAFIYGLSINNHQMMMLLAPVYFLFLLSAEWKRRQTKGDQFSSREPRRSLAWLDSTGQVVRAILCKVRVTLAKPSAASPSRVPPIASGDRAGEAEYSSSLDEVMRVLPMGNPNDLARFGARKLHLLEQLSRVIMNNHLAPRYLIAFLLFTLGLSFYLFVLLRAGQDPLLNWDHPETLARLWDHFTRKSYHDVSMSLWGDLWQLKKIIYVHFFFLDLFKQLGIAVAGMALAGFLVAWFRARPLFLLTLGVFLMNSVAIVFLRKLGYQYEGEQIYRVYYLPAYLIAFLWAGLGLHAGGQWLQARAASLHVLSAPVRRAIGVAALALLPFLALVENFHANDRSEFWLARDWGIAVLASLAPHAVLIPANEQPSADSQIFTLLYLTLIEGVRPDVAIVDASNISSRFYHPRGPDIEAISKLPFHQFRTRLLNRVWPLAQKVRRPVYTLYPVGSPLLNGDLIARSNGLAFRVFPNLETARAAELPPADPVIRNTEEERWMDGAYYRDFVSDIYFARAAYLLEQGHFKPSEDALINAFNLDQTPLSANTYDYMAYRARWLEADNVQ